MTRVRTLNDCFYPVMLAAITCCCLPAGVLAADERGINPFDVFPGANYWWTPEAHIEFGTPDLPPIPEGFFDPGSDPFVGRIDFVGMPIDPAGLGETDTIIQRTGTAPLNTNGSVATVPIEIQQLQLRSVEPIAVGSGLWDVFVSLPPAQPGSGNMTIIRIDELGGEFFWSGVIQPVYVFEPVFGGPPLILEGHPPITVNSNPPAAWWYEPPEPPLPDEGPNFFPITETVMEHPGTYAQTVVPLIVQACCLPDGSCGNGPAIVCLDEGGTPQGPLTLCAGDADGDGVDDLCARDCNSNGIEDHLEIAAGSAHDANSNGIPDVCDIAECRSNDLNHNGIPDEADVAAGTATDNNNNGLIDEVEQPATENSYISMQDGKLSDAKLAMKLKELLVNTNGTANAKDVKLFFQQCFGGGMLDDIEDELGDAVPWVAGSASRHDEVSFGERDDPMNSNGPMDRWTRPLVDALDDLPVLRALKKAARDDAANPMNRSAQTERPQYRFSGDEARGITLKDPDASSHHAVLLAGKPDAQRHRNDIRKMCELLEQEWGNLDTNGTSVQVLFGDGTDNPCAGSGVPDGNVSAATTAGFCAVLDALRPLMNENEEFVLYVSDHGTGSAECVNDKMLRGGDVFGYTVTIPAGYRYGLIRDPFNDGPTMDIHATGAYPADTVEVFFNGASIGVVDPAAVDPNGQNVTRLPISEGAVLVGLNTLTIDASAAGGGVAIVSAVFHLNDINTVPAPGWGDFDGDGDVDYGDHVDFIDCLNGPNGGYLLPICINGDVDDDGDVDLVDFMLVQKVFTGAL